MHTHRFGRKLKLPATIAIKHQIRKLMFEELVQKAETRVDAGDRSLSEKAPPVDTAHKGYRSSAGCG